MLHDTYQHVKARLEPDLHPVSSNLTWFNLTKKLNNASLGNSMACLTPSSLNSIILILLYQACSRVQPSLLTSSFDFFLTCIFLYYLLVFAAPWLWILFKQLVHFKTASATSNGVKEYYFSVFALLENGGSANFKVKNILFESGACGMSLIAASCFCRFIF